MIAGATPSTRPDPATARLTAATPASGKYLTPVADPAWAARLGVAPRAATSSSVWPSDEIAEERIVCVIVSPVASAAAMIAVPSISPTTMSALRPGRRSAFRMPSRRNTRFRAATTATAASAAASVATRTTARIPIGMPKSLVMAGYPIATAGASARTTLYISRPGGDR